MATKGWMGMGRLESVDGARDLPGILQQIRLAWRLWRDRRVPVLTKLVPLLGLAYVVVPLDLLADPMLGLGQVDDLGVVILALKLFMSLCPKALVAQHKQQLAQGKTAQQPEGDVVDAAYRVVDDTAQSATGDAHTK